MVRVCEDLFPMGSFPYQKKAGFYIHDILKEQLDYYIKNIVDDWEFTIVIAGSGGVRVGKSELAFQIAQYWTDQMKKVHGIKVPFNLHESCVFDGRELIKKGNYLGQNYKYSCLIFDEAGADLEGTKSMLATTRAVRDYLRECGQYNMLTLVVIPEFFDLPKPIAVNRTSALLNVYYIPDSEGNFQRGHFDFYSRPGKAQLFMKGKRHLDYQAHSADFPGDFNKFFPLDREKYKKIKVDALKKRESVSVDKKLMQRNIAWWLLTEKFGLGQTDVARITTDMGSYTLQQTVQHALNGLSLSEAAKRSINDV